MSGAERALLAVLIVVLMMGMGATLDRGQLRDVLRKPRGLLIGVVSQFGWMPLIAFALATTLQLPAPLALGLLIVGCTPGGTTSNLFAYFAKADVALSIGMTAFSTVVAIIAMPAVLWVYGRGFTDANVSLPLTDVAVTLTLILLPVAAGMAIRAKSITAAKRVEQLGSAAGIAVLLVLIGSALLNNHETFRQIPAVGYIAAAGLGLIGMALGYLGARLVGLSEPQRRAVSFETGIQNSPLAIGIILTAFPQADQDTLLWMPLLYALCVLVNATLITGLLRIFGR